MVREGWHRHEKCVSTPKVNRPDVLAEGTVIKNHKAQNALFYPQNSEYKTDDFKIQKL